MDKLKDFLAKLLQPYRNWRFKKQQAQRAKELQEQDPFIYK